MGPGINFERHFSKWGKHPVFRNNVQSVWISSIRKKVRIVRTNQPFFLKNRHFSYYFLNKAAPSGKKSELLEQTDWTLFLKNQTYFLFGKMSFKFIPWPGNITPKKQRKSRQMQLRDRTAYARGLCYRWDPSLSRKPLPRFPHFMPPCHSGLRGSKMIIMT